MLLSIFCATQVHLLTYLHTFLHAQEALVIVDKMYSEVPDLMKDAYWDEKRINLPVTEATAAFQKVHFAGTTARIRLVHCDFAPVSYTHLTLPTKRIV